MTMPRYMDTTTWYKGNTHIHSTASDGGWSFAELAEGYAEVGYDFLIRTDHWVASDVASDTSEYPLVWLDGVELDGVDAHGGHYHVVCVGRFSGLERSMGLEAALEVVAAQGGLRILAHPLWMGNSFDEATRYDFEGVEIYNHVCRWLNGKADGLAYWQAMLEQRPGTLGFAVDDAHIRPEHPGWNGGWVMVQADVCTTESILAGLRQGRFYSSTGPDLYRIVLEGTHVTIETSPVKFARLVGPSWRGRRIGSFDDTWLTTATFEIPEDWPYAYIEIEDACGHRAWTNTLWIGDEEAM